MSDGLDSLDALAARAKRRTPPPRRRVMSTQHPAAPASVPPTAPMPDTEHLEEHLTPSMFEVAPPTPALTPTPTPPPTPQQVTATAPDPTPNGGDLRKVAVYLDEQTDAVLDAIRYAGALARPRQDVSKSAVVRLALNRLLGELSHEEVVAAIAAQPNTQQGAGRKRR